MYDIPCRDRFLPFRGAEKQKTKGGLLYMDRIHTPRDTVFREENIAFLTDGSLRLTQALADS